MANTILLVGPRTVLLHICIISLKCFIWVFQEKLHKQSIYIISLKYCNIERIYFIVIFDIQFLSRESAKHYEGFICLLNRPNHGQLRKNGTKSLTLG